MLLLSIAMFSCKKDRICVCTETIYYTNGPTTTTTFTDTYKNTTQREIKTICKDFSRSMSGASANYTCKIK